MLSAAMQSHYAIVQALALDEDEMPEIVDETLPDEEGMSRYSQCFMFSLSIRVGTHTCLYEYLHHCRPGIVKALEEFKLSVYGENYDEETENAAHGKANNASKKRKQAIEESAMNKASYYNWEKLADDGKVFYICHNFFF